jgi:predicted membrane-bound mannosyltransferase
MKAPRGPRVGPGTMARYWGAALVAGLVVTGVVGALLHILASTAEAIQGGAAEIWRVGKLIANNTVHIPLLIRTNQLVASILGAADGIAVATARIAAAVTGKPQA